jgi:protein TonB
MMWRLFVCFTVSAMVHVLVLMLPLVIMAKPSDFLPRRDVLSVKLVEGMQQIKELVEANKPVENQKSEAVPEEGVSFEAEGGVGAGYLDPLKVKIFRVWQYPEDAIQKGQQGKVSISFVLNSKGELVDIGILTSSGSYSLDTAAMAAIEQASPFGSFTGDIKERTLKVTGHFCYVLD